MDHCDKQLQIFSVTCLVPSVQLAATVGSPERRARRPGWHGSQADGPLQTNEVTPQHKGAKSEEEGAPAPAHLLRPGSGEAAAPALHPHLQGTVSIRRNRVEKGAGRGHISYERTDISLHLP